MSILSLKNAGAWRCQFGMKFVAGSRCCHSDPKHIRHCYLVLGVSEGADQETVRQAFLDLVKRHHPDSKSPEADAVKFQQIESAYRTIQENFARKRFKRDQCEGEYGLYYEEKVDNFDIEHTAPQHRQYLNYDGIGSGTPSQRQRQFNQHKVSKGLENVADYRIKKLNDTYATDLTTKGSLNKKKVKDIRTGFGMDRLVEDLIQESMTRGEFDNLGGSGKPLKGLSTYNPYVDFVTHKMNEVLIDNGFTPQWITLQKEIRDQIKEFKDSLVKTRKKIGPLPLDESEETYWKDEVNRWVDTIAIVNKNIDTYNLVVPILDKQMLHFDIEKEAEKILKEAPHGLKVVQNPQVYEKDENKKRHFLDILNGLFQKQ